MPLVSAVSTPSLASLVSFRERRAPSRAQRARDAQAEEQLFEPRSELGELLHALGLFQPIERG